MLKTYGFSIVFSIVCAACAAYWGQETGLGMLTALWLVGVLGVLEVSLSFDNAVVNAAVLRDMSPFWQKMFLTVGILIAVFGMRLLFPIVIVAVITGLSHAEVMHMALNTPDQYGQVLTDAYPMIATFGGSFLLMVFLSFMLDPERETHWLGLIERRLAACGKLDSFAVLLALVAVVATAWVAEPALQFKVLLSGVSGVLLFQAINMIDQLFQQGTGGLASGAGKLGFSAFLYLEVLDASFSFDGVVGAFAITRDVVIIMLGLAIGAIFVRSITIDLVRRGVLQEYVYLEHGAHYAIGVLAVLMFVGTKMHIPEALTGLIGIAFVLAAYASSIRRKHSLT